MLRHFTYLAPLLALFLAGSSALAAGPRPSAAAAGKPQNIVSCALASDEILTDLLQRAGTPARLKAVSQLASDARYSNVAERAESLPGARCGGELESLLRLKPDLAVVATYTRPEALRRLEQAHVPVLVIGPFPDLASITSAVRQLGDAVHEPAAAAAMTAAFTAELQRLQRPARVPPRRLLQYFGNGTVSGRHTLFDDLVGAAGAVNAAAAHGLSGWPRVDAETLARLQPDAIVAEGTDAERSHILAAMRAAPGFKEQAAVKAGRLILIPSRELSAASPHVLKGLAKLHAGLEALFPPPAPPVAK